MLCWSGVASLLALGGAHLYGRAAASGHVVARVLPVHQAWLYNIGLLETRCRCTNETWSEIERVFRDTVQYDDVAAHKACQKARAAGCARGSCDRRGCLDRRGDHRRDRAPDTPRAAPIISRRLVEASSGWPRPRVDARKKVLPTGRPRRRHVC